MGHGGRGLGQELFGGGMLAAGEWSLVSENYQKRMLLMFRR